jgi:hypothetical protein
MMKLLTVGNPKTLKGEKQGYLTFILHLAPADVSGYQTCPKATAGCKASCLNTAGRGGMFKKGANTNVIQEARKRKTHYFFENREEFMRDLVADIAKGIRYAEKRGLIPVFRLNGTSDIAWEKIRTDGYRNIMEQFPTYTFYDYTAIVGRKVPSNYHLTFSKKENNMSDTIKAIQLGMNVAVVFDTKKDAALPEKYLNLPVFNADESDLRFLDPKGVICGLYMKGRAKKDTSGFVVRSKMIPIMTV